MHRDPGPVNSIFGYRTSLSCRNEDTWYCANVYAGRLLMVFTVMFMLVLVATEMMYKNIFIIASLISIFLVFTAAIVFLMTESHLKKTFFRDGKRRPSF